MYGTPTTIGDTVFDKEWRRVDFQGSTLGVPSRIEQDFPGTYDYAAAQALRYWWIANLSAVRVTGSLCIETRLVEYHCERSHTQTAVAYIDPLDARGELPGDFKTEPPHDPA